MPSSFMPALFPSSSSASACETLRGSRQDREAVRGVRLLHPVLGHADGVPSGTRSPASMNAFARWPSSVFLLMLARKRSPVEMCGDREAPSQGKRGRAPFARTGRSDEDDSHQWSNPS